MTIRSEETLTAYVITISDTGGGFDENAPTPPDNQVLDNHPHVGIANVRSRLQLMSDGTLIVESELGKGTIATITIPKESGEDE